MEKIDFINIFLGMFAIWLIFVPFQKISDKKIFLLGVVLFSAGLLFSLIKYLQVAEIYFRLSLLCLIIGTLKAGIKYKDGN